MASAGALPEPLARLDEVFDALRARDRELDASPRERVRVRALLLRLAELGQSPRDFNELGGWLAPVVATSAAQQTTVQAVCSWLQTQAAEAREPVPPAPEPAPVPPFAPPRPALRSRLRRSWGWLVAGAALLALLLLVYWAPSGGGGGGTGPGPAKPINIVDPNAVVRSLMACLPLLVAWRAVARLRRGRAAFTQQQRTATTREIRLPLAAAAVDLWSAATVRRRLSRLRLHRPMPTDRIDVRRTIDSASRHFGLVTEIPCELRFAAVGHLVLIDRLTEGDHLGAIGDLLVQRLTDADAPVVGYDLQRDPTRLVARGRRLGVEVEVFNLKLIAEQHAGDCAVIVAPAERLLDPFNRRPGDWLRELRGLHPVCLLTPTARRDWDRAELALIGAGIAVFPATTEGVQDYAAWTVLISEFGAEQAPPPRPPALSLGRRRVEIAAAHVFGPAPDAATIAELVYELRATLSPAAFELLCTLAIFSAIEPQLTFYLGRNLLRGDRPLLNEERLAELARYAWLRHAHMPHWLRIALLAELPPARAEDARLLLLAYFDPPLDAPPAPAGRALRVALDTPDMARRLERLVAFKDEDAPERETLFLRFMRREEITLLDLEAPRELARELEADVRRRFGRIWVAGGLATVVLGWALMQPPAARLVSAFGNAQFALALGVALSAALFGSLIGLSRLLARRADRDYAWDVQGRWWVWSYLPLLWACCMQYRFGAAAASFDYLLFPFAAWLGARHGARGHHVLCVGTLSLFILVSVGGLSVGVSEGIGLFFALQLVSRLFGQSGFRIDCMAANTISRRQLAYLFIILFVYVDWAGAFAGVDFWLSTKLDFYVLFLFLVLGMSKIPFRQILPAYLFIFCLSYLVSSFSASFMFPRIDGFKINVGYGGLDSLLECLTLYVSGVWLRRYTLGRQQISMRNLATIYLLIFSIYVTSGISISYGVSTDSSVRFNPEISFGTGFSGAALLFVVGAVGGGRAALVACLLWILVHVAGPSAIIDLQSSLYLERTWTLQKFGELSFNWTGASSLIGTYISMAPGWVLGPLDPLFALFGWLVHRGVRRQSRSVASREAAVARARGGWFGPIDLPPLRVLYLDRILIWPAGAVVLAGLVAVAAAAVELVRFLLSSP